MVALVDLWANSKTPSEIEAALRVRFNAEAPSLRTIQYIVRELDPPDPSATWSLAEADPDDARLILPVLAAIIERTEGKRALTVSVAEWVVRLSRAGASDMHPWGLYQLARLYREREAERGAQDAHTADLDAFLGYAPWRDYPSRFDDFTRALEAGWVETPHAAKIFLIWKLQGICTGRGYLTARVLEATIQSAGSEGENDGKSQG